MLLFQQAVDGDLQRPGLEEQQRAEGVEERLQRLRQVAALLGAEAWRQAVVGQLLHGHVGQSRANGLQHGQRERRLVRFSEGIWRQTQHNQGSNWRVEGSLNAHRLILFKYISQALRPLEGE